MLGDAASTSVEDGSQSVESVGGGAPPLCVGPAPELTPAQGRTNRITVSMSVQARSRVVLASLRTAHRLGTYAISPPANSQKFYNIEKATWLAAIRPARDGPPKVSTRGEHEIVATRLSMELRDLRA